MTRDCSLNSPKNTSAQNVVYKYILENSMNKLWSYFWLTDARMRASEKDLPVYQDEKRKTDKETEK